MGKQTRRGFLAASGAITAAALIGCAAGAPPNSTYQGTYRSVYAIPGVGENGTFNYSIEQKGKINGLFVDSTSGKVWSFNGNVTNNGRFEGSLSDGAQTSPVAGTLSRTGGNFEVTRGGQVLRGDFQVDGKLDQTQSTYQGTYTGVYNVPGLSLSGTNNFTIDSKGNLIGAITRGEETGLMSGTVSNAGTIVVSARFASETLPMTGTIIKTVDGTSQGNFTITRAGNVYAGIFKKATETIRDENGNTSEVNPFQGAFRGTYGIPEIAEDGSISFTVDKTGKFTGLIEARSGTVGTISGSVTAEGLFSGSVTYNNGSPERAVAGRMAKTRIANGDSESGSADGRSGNFTIVVGGTARAASFEATVGAAEVNSLFKGNYRSAGFVSGFIPLRATISGGNYQVGSAFTFRIGTTIGSVNTVASFVSIDQQGAVLGVVDTTDLEGRITNDGRFQGTMRGSDGVKYPVRGVLGKSNVTYIETPATTKTTRNPGPDQVEFTADDIVTVEPVPPVTRSESGFSGTIYLTVGGVDYPFSVTLLS